MAKEEVFFEKKKKKSGKRSSRAAMERTVLPRVSHVYCASAPPHRSTHTNQTQPNSKKKKKKKKISLGGEEKFLGSGLLVGAHLFLQRRVSKVQTPLSLTRTFLSQKKMET
jgi:hypothetical protein